ncbi:MAG: anthranilate phosphoribosyltransferase [Rhodospirillaceae bacterium]|nr:anthranilate phosphoribosyltransferase [Rhodospirillaceae bacterium]
MGQLKTLLALVADGKTLTRQQAETAFDIMMTGNATPAQIGAFLMALRVRGETVEEITAAARIMRAKALRVEAPPDAIDAVGTGGDALGSFNISTATAIVVAGCGVPVAKHGNRAFSSKSGSADVLTALGVNVDVDPNVVAQAIRDAGVGFMMAPRHHSAMRHVGPTRVELGIRTIFNLIGPLSNPAFVVRQLVGVFAKRWVEPVANVLANLGSVHAWVVHGADGMDELTTTGPTFVAELKDGRIDTFEVTPEAAGLPRASLDQLKGGDPQTNAAMLREVLNGRPGPIRDVVLYNAAAALIVADRVRDLKEGVALAGSSIDSGRARSALDRLIEITNRKSV